MKDNKISSILKNSKLDVHSPEIQQLLLRFIDRNGNDSETYLAVKKIDDQDALVRIAHSSVLHDDAIAAAVDKITDQATLLDIVEANDGSYLRLRAAEKLKDPAKITKALQYKFNFDVSLKIFRRVRTQQLWAEIALFAYWRDIRYMAATKIPSHRQDLFRYIVKNSEDKDVKWYAIEQIEDQKLLFHIAIANSRYSDVEQEHAILRISNENLLAKIADAHPESSCRASAVQRICNQSTLVNFAKCSASDSVRRAAVKRLYSQPVLSDIATHDLDSSVRLAAVGRIRDQKVLNWIVKHDQSEFVRERAVEMIWDQNMLSEIALTNRNPGVREAATKRITDQAILVKIVETDREVSVRKEAISKIDDKETLIKLCDVDQDNIWTIFEKLGIL